MTTRARENTIYGIDASVTRYTDIALINNGSCCFHAHNPKHQHDDHQLDKPFTFYPKGRKVSRKVHDGKRTNISIITKSSSSASFVPKTKEVQKKKSRDSGKSEKESQEREEKDDKDDKDEKDDKEKGMKMNRLLVLLILFVLYVSLGAVVFNALEAGPEQDRKNELETIVERFLIKNPCVNSSDLYDLLQKAVVDSEIVYYVVENKTHLDRWDFSGAFGFVVSVVTTIGFGNMSPFTMEGKVVCVVYALFGIPLTLLVLGGLGETMASFISKIKKCKNPMCHHTPRVNRMLNIFYIASLGVVLIFVAPAAMFTYVEQWYFMESVYFCFTTLSTIGFGDYVIGIHEKRLTSMLAHELYEVIAYVWILLGLAYLSLVYRYITDNMVAKAQEVGRSTIIRRLGKLLSVCLAHFILNDIVRTKKSRHRIVLSKWLRRLQQIDRTPELHKSTSKIATPTSSTSSSRASSPEVFRRYKSSIQREDTELFCEIDIPMPVAVPVIGAQTSV